MVGISHDEAVAILKAVQDTAVLKVEKNAVSMSSQVVSTDDEESVSRIVFTMLVLLYLIIASCYTSTYCGVESP